MMVNAKAPELPAVGSLSAADAPYRRQSSVSEMLIQRVLISDPIDPVCVKMLLDAGIQVDCRDKVPKDELIKIIPNYDALIVRSGTTVTADIIAASKLTIIGRAGTGVDNIDVEAATRHGVIVLNTPGGNTISAAEHTCAMLQTLCRNIPQTYSSLMAGKWDRKGGMGVELNCKTLGIVGLGRIGREVAKRFQAFGVKTIGYDPILPKEVALKFGVEAMELDQMWPQCDFISLHTPLTEQTRDLLNDQTIAKCKKGFRIVNCARGGIINEEALLRALESGQCGGAALDVFEEEPPTNPITLKLIQHKNCIATPHLGASTVEAQNKVAVEIADSIIKATRGGQLVGAVNAPSLTNAFAPELQPWVVLATKMGALVSQILGGAAFDGQAAESISNISVIARGNLIKGASSTLSSAVLCGLLSHLRDTPVNLVNATHFAEEAGIRVSEDSSEADDQAYQNVIAIRIDGAAGKTHWYEGTVVGKDSPRLVMVDSYRLEARPDGHMLLYSNDDKPGILGRISTLLGSASINIGDFNMGRDPVEGRALSILHVDQKIEKNILEEIRRIPGMRFARIVQL
eukprot:comp23030_c0_seq1/m.36816 comp23030_c0_seq1/g.36816  ORF comp23030_c0_seq1/g.36816 comp23030_c0_seq1/m.36816 type:complete len:573 (-) comp23030_c0_seq1:584-2302(-)